LQPAGKIWLGPGPGCWTGGRHAAAALACRALSFAFCRLTNAARALEFLFHLPLVQPYRVLRGCARHCRGDTSGGRGSGAIGADVRNREQRAKKCAAREEAPHAKR
jgi:hypothetical protein